MKFPALVGLLAGALVACQPTPIELTPELEATCIASVPEEVVDTGAADRVLDLGTSPQGAKERCFEMTWPIGETTHVNGFRVVGDGSASIHRSEVFEIRTDETLDELFGVTNDTANGFECPGVLGDDRLLWWFQANQESWFISQAGARKVSGGTRLLVRVTYDDALGAESTASSEWLTTSSPNRIAETVAVYDPFWLFNGAFELPPGETSVERTFILDLATRLALDQLTLRQVRIETGAAATQTFLGLQRSDGDQLCIDLRSTPAVTSLTASTLAEPVVVNEGDLIQLTCTWDTSNKTASSPWSMTEESCRAVLVYTTEDSQ